MPSRRRVLAALAAVLFTAGACDLSLESGSLAGTYALASYGGDPLPAVAFDDTERGRLELLADTLRLRGDGTGSRVTVSRWRPPGATATLPTERRESQLGYEVRGNRLEISFVCGPHELCAEGPHLTGRANGASIRLTVITTRPEGGVYLFRRIGL